MLIRVAQFVINNYSILWPSGEYTKSTQKAFTKKNWFTLNISETILVKANCAEQKKSVQRREGVMGPVHLYPLCIRPCRFFGIANKGNVRYLRTSGKFGQWQCSFHILIISEKVNLLSKQ